MHACLTLKQLQITDMICSCNFEKQKKLTQKKTHVNWVSASTKFQYDVFRPVLISSTNVTLSQAHQLEEKEKELKKRDALYKEHLAKLDTKCAEFYKVSVESFRKGKEETLSRFTRFNTQPVCGDLQSQILKCYKENTGKTLCCSRIAAAYMQCVDEAKKNKMSTGG